MAYAQRNYGERLGNGSYTIAEAGCLLTAIANLLARYGEAIAPDALNQFYIDKNAYIRDPDGAYEDLSWQNSPSVYDPSIHCTGVFVGGLPNTADAIVKFHYNSVHTGQPIDHYCKVDHIDGTQVFIIDSWDGQVKSPAQYEPTYHNILAYATYAKSAPAPAPTPAPAAPTTAPNLSDTYDVVKDIPGYLSSSFAATHINTNSTVPEGHYYVFNRFNGMVNVTRVPGVPGWWVNPADNVMPLPTPAPTDFVSPREVTPAPSTTIAVPAPVVPPVAPAESDWRTTYRPFLNKSGQRTPVKYAAVENYVVEDLAGQKADVPIHTGWIVWMGGTFVKDGKVWGRPQDAVDRFLWYGIPLDGSVVETYTKIYDTKTTTAERQLLNEKTAYDHVVIGFEGLRSFFSPLWNWVTGNKNK
jgi:hypothetical protein